MLPPPPLSPLPSNPLVQLSKAQPTHHLHPQYLITLRNRLTKDSKVLFLLRTLLKKVLVDESVHSVTFSPRYGPGGPRAFFSFAKNFIPNEAELSDYLRLHPGATREEWMDQISWSRIPGRTNTDDMGAQQGAQLNDMCYKVFLLTLGHHFAIKFDPSSAEKSAEKAWRLLWVFFGDPVTAMLPEVDFGQYIPGNQETSFNRPEGLLHIRSILQISHVLPLLPSPPSYTYSSHSHSSHESTFMHDWLARHVAFLETSTLGTRARERRNNIKSFYYAQLTTHLITLNRPLEAYQHLLTFSRSLATKVDPRTDVLIHEITRTNPFHYTAFELEALVFLADLSRSLALYSRADLAPACGGGAPMDLYRVENCAIRRALDFGLRFYLATHAAEGQRKELPMVERAEKEADIRELVFSARSTAVALPAPSAGFGPARAFGDRGTPMPSREDYSWIAGKGGLTGDEMEPLAGKTFEPSVVWRGWTVRARLSWAILEGY